MPRSWFKAPEPRLLVRCVLGLNVVVLIAQLIQLQPEAMTTDAHRRGLAALVLLTAVAALGWATSLMAYDWLGGRTGRFAGWLLAGKARTWAAAFAAFQLFTLTGLAIDRHPIFPHGSELLGVIGFVDAAAILLARRWYFPSPPTPLRTPPPAPPRTRGGESGKVGVQHRTLAERAIPDWAIAAGIAAAGAVTSALMWLYAPPLAYGNFDSYRNFFSSEGLLGRQPLDFFWYTYPYPLLIAATRLIADTVASIVILQHAVRVGVAVVIFWWLRDTQRLTGALAGLLVALSPISAFNAHQLRDASLYSACVALIALLAFRASRPDEPIRPGELIAIGLLCGWTAVLRPLGQLLILPTLLVVIVFSRSWQRAAWIAAGLAAAALILASGQWLIDGRFRLGTDEEAFYAAPTIFLGLYDPANGPVAQSYQAMLDSQECAYEIPEQRWQIAQHWPHQLHNCAVAYNAAHGTHLSTRALYLEAIRAKPGVFARNLILESRLFLTHSDTGPLREDENRFARMPFFEQTWSLVDGCRGERPEYSDLVPIDSWLTYTCTYPIPQTALADLVPRSYDAALIAMQPYRLQGESLWGRFWAALALLAFAWIEGPKRLRALIALCALFIAYHAVVSTAAMFPEPRYVYFSLPLFFLIVAAELATLWDGIRAMPSRAGQVAAVGLIALLPLLPGLIEPLWVDTAWTGRYYTNPDLTGRPALVREDGVVTFDWGESGPFPGEQPVDGFSARWERTDLFDAGVYTFAVRSDDGVRLYVDGELMLDLWAEGFHDWTAVDRPMTAGRHRIRLEYFEATGPATVQAGYYLKETDSR